LVIGAKEGVVEAITKLVSSNVTNAILRTANSRNHKSINDFTLYKVMEVAIDSADQPSTNNVLEQLIKAINHNFNFCKKVRVNMELMQLNAAQMATYGIVVGILQLRLTLLANIKTATKSNYSHKFCLAMHAICKKYMYNHVHDVALLQIILKKLVGAEGVRVLKDAPTPGAGTAHLVPKLVSYLQALMDGDTSSTCTKLAYSVNSDSNLSEEDCRPCGHDARNPNFPSCVAATENRRGTRMTSQRRTRAPSAKSSMARSLIELNQTSACGTRSTRVTASNQSVTSSKWR
jgi:hypothetical protein